MALFPVFPVTLPTAADGGHLANGKLGPCDLVSVFFPNVGHMSMAKNAARAWAWLAVTCQQATGALLTATSAGDVYRSLDMQTTVFLQRYTPDYLPDRNVLTDRRARTIGGALWYKRHDVAAVATPGTSNHGYGLAVDVAVDNVNGTRRYGDDRGITANPVAWAWLLANAMSFGFSWESQAEAWHIRHVLGDDVSQRVLECEAWVAAAGS